MSAPAMESLLRNPIVVKSVRSRLRWRHIISWGLVVLTVTGFVTAITYLVQTEQELHTAKQAARVTLLPVIIIQAVILMLLGTGAVASGVALERDRGLLDYQRMTPMSPASKLLGYLFGLPAREYFLFALTLPFLAFGVIRGGFPLATVANFYVIFFSSVFVYHMTGMAAGMASSNPRRAGVIAQGMVLILYFVLPNLSHLGLTFFEFLTIRPALLGLISDEIERAGGVSAAFSETALTALDSFRDVPFFTVSLRPSAYTLLVQGGLLITLWTVVHRKWRNERALPFSKVFGLLFFTCASLFVLGSLWPILTDTVVFAQLVDHMSGGHLERSGASLEPETVTPYTGMLLAVALGVLGVAALITVLCTTPDRHKSVEGWRRASRLGLRSVRPTWDAASSLPVAVASALVMSGVYLVIVTLALREDRFFENPSALALAAPCLYVVGLLLFLQATLERHGKRAFFVSVFLLWMIPFFSAVLLAAAFERETLSAYVSLPFPPAGLFFASLNIIESAAPERNLSETPPELARELPALAITGAALYTSLAAMSVGSLVRWRTQLRTAA